MPKLKAQNKVAVEGWQAEKPYSQRVYHYIVDSFSLCKRLGFYFGELMPHKGEKGREDCAECYRRAVKRAARTTTTGGDSK